MTMPALGRKFPKTSVLKGETRHSGETGGFSIIKNIHTISSLLCNARLNHPHMLVNGGPRYPIALGHIPHNDTGITKQGADLPNLLPVQFRPSSPLAPSSAGCGQSRLGPLSDQVALKLGQGRKYMKNQP